MAIRLYPASQCLSRDFPSLLCAVCRRMGSDGRRQHAGENLSQVLEQRQADLPKPLVMSDALSANTLTNEDEVIRCYCLFQGRRQFDDIKAVFPEASTRVIDDLNQVFHPEAHTRQQAMSGEQRLAYHQRHSRPVLDALKPWLEK